MKKFCLASLGWLAVWGLCVAGCTPTDRLFGNDMIPPSQQLTTRIDTVMPLSTYQVTFDSVASRVVGPVRTALLPLGYMGSWIDPLVGRTTMGTIANFVPDPYVKSKQWQEFRFGFEPKIDSVKLNLQFAREYAVGDTTREFRVKVYELNKRLRSETPFYTCTDPNQFYDPNQRPLLEFSTTATKSVQLHLPKAYADRFLIPEYNQPGEKNPYGNDSIFLDAFNGLYFKVDPINPGTNPGSIGAISLSSSEIRMYYHNKGKAEGQKPDTAATLGYFFFYANPDNPLVYYTPHNTSFLVAERDYDLATDPNGVDPTLINNLSVECPVGFVQGLGGLAVLAKMDRGVIDELKAKARALGFSNVGVHRAELRWKVPERSLHYYNDSYSYLVLTNWIGSKSEFLPLRDYNPHSSKNKTNALGGYLSRSLGYYSQNITSYIQQVLGGSNTNVELLLYPDYGMVRQDIDPLRSAVCGSGFGQKELRPELIITYTLIR